MTLSLSALNFMIVDDSVHMRRIVAAMLRGFGARSIVEAEDGADALEKIEVSAPDVIILDWVMPVLDGAELVRLIRKPDHPAAYASIIMLSGHTERSRVVTGSKLGINHFLSKPISAKGLYERITDCVLYPRRFVRSSDYFGPEPRELRENWHRGLVGVMTDDAGEPIHVQMP